MEILNGKVYNALLYKVGAYYYYFNSDGIYSVIRAESIDNLPEEINCSLYNPRDRLIDFSKMPLVLKKEFRNRYGPYELLSFVRRLVVGDTIEYFDSMLEHYIRGKATDTTYRVNINRIVKIDPEAIKNVIIRKTDSTVFYFNKNGIYVCESFKKKEKVLRKDNVADILGIGGENTWAFKRLLTLIPDGATIEYLEHMIASNDAALYVDTHNPCTYGVKYFITEVCKPQIKRSYGNTNEKTFDYIEINMGVACMDMEYIKNNIRSIVNIAIHRIAKDPEYKKYGIEVNYLRVTGCYSLEGQRLYTKLINGIKLVFELKNI